MIDKIIPQNCITRSSYIKKVEPYIDTHIIKVFMGQRRSGKSYILFNIIEHVQKKYSNANIVYINTELQQFAQIQNNQDLYKHIDQNISADKKNFVFIDEIQTINGFEHTLKSLFAENRCDLYCSGSNAQLLSGELATHIAGRYIQINVHPLSYSEFLQFHSCKNSEESLRSYLLIGGMPYLAFIPDSDELRFEYLKNVYESILYRDVIAREKIRNTQFLETLVLYAATNVGNLFSATNISKYLKSQKIAISVQTVISYLKAIEKSYVIRRVLRSDVKGLKTFEVGEKIYFEDTGIRNCLCGFHHADIGKLVENAVYRHLIDRGYTVTVGQIGNKEIDFVAQKQGNKIYVQAAYLIENEVTAEREFGNLLLTGDNYPKYVVTLDPFMQKTNYKGIEHIHLKDFLLNV